MMCTRMQ